MDTDALESAAKQLYAFFRATPYPHSNWERLSEDRRKVYRSAMASIMPMLALAGLQRGYDLGFREAARFTGASFEESRARARDQWLDPDYEVRRNEVLSHG